MGGTALKRKARRNKARAKAKNHMIKVQGFKPVIKTVDVEAIKEEFKKKATPAPKAKAKAEDVKEEKTEAKIEAKATEASKEEVAVKEKPVAKKKESKEVKKEPKSEKTETKKSGKKEEKSPGSK